MRSALASNDFWYRRVKILSRTPDLTQRSKVDWKRVYYGIEDRSNLSTFMSNYPSELSSAYGLEDIDTLLVFEEIYGQRSWKDEMSGIWSAIKDAKVLDHLLTTNQLTYDNNDIRMLIAMAQNNLALIQHALELMPESDRLEEERDLIVNAANEGRSNVVEFLLTLDHIANDVGLLEEALGMAASRRGDQVTIRLLADRITNRSILEESVKRAVQSGNGEALLVLMEILHTTRDEMNGLLEQALASKREGSILVLLQKGIRSDLLRSLDFLLASIKHDHLRIVPLILKHVSPVSRDNTALKLAATSPLMFQILFADQRIKIGQSLGPIIKASRHADKKDNALFRGIADNPSLSATQYNTNSGIYAGSMGDSANLRAEQVAEMLVQDDRVVVEDLNKSQLRLLSWSLLGHTRQLVDTMESASKFIGKKIDRWEIGGIIEDSSSYSLLLRYILLKRPSKLQLMDWIIDREDLNYSDPATRVLDNNLSLSSARVPIQALFMSLLYPKMKLEEILDQFRTDKSESIIVEASIVEAAWLIAVARKLD